MAQIPDPSGKPASSFDADIKSLPPEESGDQEQSGQQAFEQAEAADSSESEKNQYSNYSEPTKTDKTAAEYVEKGSRILRKAQRELGLLSTDGPDLLEAIQHIVESRDQLTKASWRYYKAALIHYISTEKDPLDNEVEAAQVALLQASTDICKGAGTGKGSSRKRKAIPKEDLEKLVEGAKKSGRYDDKNLAMHAVEWLVCATIIGLRPAEWQHVEIEHNEFPNETNPKRQHKIRFVVQNAKATNGRAHGPTRRFVVSTDTETKDYILRVYERTTSLNGTDFGLYLKNCRQALRRLCRRTWPKAESKNYTLYTGRHQFSANQKASGKSKKEVSYLMGHKVTKTAIQSYGKKRQGWGSTPEATEVAPDEVGFERLITDDAKVFQPKTPANAPKSPKSTK